MARQDSKRPNVVVFFTDQQRWDTAGVHGNPLDLMPNFDRAARSGTHFQNACTCQPVCGPARASLQTGMYASCTGVFRNGLPLGRKLPTLADLFGQAGYRTGYIGKWHLSGGGHGAVEKDARGGYEYWLASNVLEFTSWPYDTVMYDADGEPVRLPGYRVDALTDAAIRYLDRHQDDPFFLFLSYIEPHFQNQTDDYPPPDGYRERYTGAWIPPDLAALGGSTHQHIAGYYGMVKRLDEAFGRLLDALKSLGLEQNTIVLFTSDHGCHFKTRNSEYKRSCHESSIRVPTAATGPGFNGGGQIREMFSTVDIAPTLLDVAGLPVPDSMQGHSAMPLLRGEREGWPGEAYVQISEDHVGRAVRTQQWKYCVRAPEAHPGRDPVAEHYVEECLYDLEADPYELTNLIGYESHKQVVAGLKERLIRRMTAIGEPRPTIEPAPARAAGQRRVPPGSEYL